jgi:hypothetical protein
MENNDAAREKRRLRYNAGILTFLSMATATIVGFISWLSHVVLEIGKEVPIP